MKHRWFFLILLQSIIYGFGDPISKLMYREITVSACLSLRFTLAAAVLLAFTTNPFGPISAKRLFFTGFPQQPSAVKAR